MNMQSCPHGIPMPPSGLCDIPPPLLHGQLRSLSHDPWLHQTMPSCWFDEVLARSAAAPPSKCTSTRAPPPRIAFLIGGVTRGFDRERMRRSFLQHVVEPLTPDPANRAVFVALKVLARTQKPRNRDSPQPRWFRELETNITSLKAGLASQFPGAALYLTRQPVDREVVVSAPLAPLPTSTELGLEPHPCNCSCFDLLRRPVAGFVTAMRRTYVMMREREVAQGWAFDLVVFSRPDLIFFAPLAPWCDERWKGVMAGHEFATVGADYLYVLPRRAATVLDETLTQSMTARAATKVWPQGSCTFQTTEALRMVLSNEAVPALRNKASVPGQDAALVRSFATHDPSCPQDVAFRSWQSTSANRVPRVAVDDTTARNIPRFVVLLLVILLVGLLVRFSFSTSSSMAIGIAHPNC